MSGFQTEKNSKRIKPFNEPGSRLTLTGWLHRSFGVQFQFGAEITRCDSLSVAAGNRRWKAERIWLCTGGELRTLFPDTLQQQNLIACKLQMMRSSPIQPRIGPMLGAGLTKGRDDRKPDACFPARGSSEVVTRSGRRPGRSATNGRDFRETRKIANVPFQLWVMRGMGASGERFR